MEAAPCTARLAPDPSGPLIYYRSFAEGRPLRLEVQIVAPAFRTEDYLDEEADFYWVEALDREPEIVFRT